MVTPPSVYDEDLDAATRVLKKRHPVLGGYDQDANTSLMIFSVPYLISYLSQCMTLLPGTVLTMDFYADGALSGSRPSTPAGLNVWTLDDLAQ